MKDPMGLFKCLKLHPSTLQLCEKKIKYSGPWDLGACLSNRAKNEERLDGKSEIIVVETVPPGKLT